MKAIAYVNGIAIGTFENATGWAMSPQGVMFLLNPEKAPIVVFAPGQGAIVFPENDTAVVRAGVLVGGDGKPVDLTK